MRRRDVLILLGVELITPLGAAAQSRLGKTWRIAFFYYAAPVPRNESVHGAFVQGMRQLGYTERQDFIIDDFVYDADKPDEAAREMVQHHVDLILASFAGRQPKPFGAFLTQSGPMAAAPAGKARGYAARRLGIDVFKVTH
jgi:hypothetical protein